MSNEPQETMTYDQWTEKYNDGGWRETLPEEIATDATLSDFKKPEDIVKSYIHTKKAFGDRIERPKEDWKKEDWNRWNKEYNPGYPKDSSEYELNVEFDGYRVSDSMNNNFRKWAHENGLTKAQAERMYNNLNKEASISFNNLLKRRNDKAAKIEAELKQEYGQAYETKMAQAKRFINTFLPSEYVEAQKNKVIDKEMIQAFVKAGEHLSENKLEDKSTPKAVYTPMEAKAKYNKYVDENKRIYLDRAHPRHEEIVREAMRLMEAAYPAEQ